MSTETRAPETERVRFLRDAIRNADLTKVPELALVSIYMDLRLHGAVGPDSK